MYLYLKQKVFAIAEKFTFFDANQFPVFTAQGSFFSIPKRFTLFSNQIPVLTVERAVFSWLPRFTVFDQPSGQQVCTMKREFSFKPNFTITSNDGVYTIRGSLFGYEFDIYAPDGQKVVGVHKKFISWGDTYEIFIDETKIQPKIAAGLVVAIDNAVHPNTQGGIGIHIGFR